MKKFIGILVLAIGSISLMQAQVLPSQAPLSSFLAGAVAQFESASFLSLDAEGLTTIPAVQAELDATAHVICNLWAASGCNDIANTEQPFLTQIQTDFSLVPATQWAAATFSNNLPANVAGYKALPKPPAPPKPVTGNIILLPCTTVTGINSPTGIICYPGPGNVLANDVDGQIVSQNGLLYVTHVSQGLMGKTVYFEPLSTLSK